MSRGLKIFAGVLVALGVLIGLNAVVTSRETKSAEVTVPGGRLMQVGGEELQYVDRGPRDGQPIVLLHGFACAIDWWDRMMPMLERRHRVVAIDMLGHGGSSKPSSGYSMPEQADLVAQLLGRLGVEGATVVGHSMGGTVAVALAERSPRLAGGLILIDTTSSKADDASLGLQARLAFVPVLGEALWRIKPDFSIRQGLEEAFADGFDVPDEFVEDVKRMNYSAYDESGDLASDYREERSLAERAAATGKPLLVIMGAEDKIIEDPQAALDAYSEAGPEVATNLISGVGHSPNVEAPSLTAKFVTGFALPLKTVTGNDPGSTEITLGPEGVVQDRVQKRDGVRQSP
jgi:pimeloyl-ACP methyl ester carboxylesterase